MDPSSVLQPSQQGNVSSQRPPSNISPPVAPYPQSPSSIPRYQANQKDQNDQNDQNDERDPLSSHISRENRPTRHKSNRRLKVSAKLYVLCSLYPGGLPCSKEVLKELEGIQQLSFVTVTYDGTQSHHYKFDKKGPQYTTSSLSEMKNFQGIEGLAHLGTVNDMVRFVEVLEDVKVGHHAKKHMSREWYKQAMVDLERLNKERRKAGKKDEVDLPRWHHYMITFASKSVDGCTVQ